MPHDPAGERRPASGGPHGSPEALGELYERCGGRLLAFIRLRMGRDLRARVESRDILQATLLKSFQRLSQFEGGDGASLMAWLVRIAENEIRDQADFQHRQRRDVAAGVPIDAGGVDLAAGVRSALSQAVLSEEAERLGARSRRSSRITARSSCCASSRS